MNLDPSKLKFASKRIRCITPPERIRIIKLLDEMGEVNAGEINRLLNIDPTDCSYHLNFLLNNGILIQRKSGRQKYYSLNTKLVEEIIDWSNLLSKR